MSKLKVNQNLCYFLGFLNMTDALSTMGLIWAGWAVEANPLMAFLINQSFWLFFACKLFFTVAIILVGRSWKENGNKFVNFILRLSVLGYCLVMIYHFYIFLQGMEIV